MDGREEYAVLKWDVAVQDCRQLLPLDAAAVFFPSILWGLDLGKNTG